MIRGLFKRLIDGVLICVVWYLCMDEYFYITDNWDIKDKIEKAEFSDGLKIFIVISLLIGVGLNICRNVGILPCKETEDIETGEKTVKGIDRLSFRIFLLAGIFFGSSALTGWLSSATGMSRETRHGIKLVAILVIALALQIVLMGSRCILGKLFSQIFNAVCYVIGFVIGTVLILGRKVINGVERLIEILGERIMLGIFQLALCVIGTLLVFGICVKTGVEHEYDKGRTYTFSQWYEEKADTFNLDETVGDSVLVKALYDKEMSAFIYCAIDYIPAGCILTSVLLILMGQGIFGALFRRLFSWNSESFDNYDRRHEERLIKISNDEYIWDNNNPHGILGIIFFCMAVATGIMGGIMMPVFIAGNFTIGIIQLIVKVVSNKIEAKES